MYCSSQKQDVEEGGMAYNDDLFNEKVFFKDDKDTM